MRRAEFFESLLRIVQATRLVNAKVDRNRAATHRQIAAVQERVQFLERELDATIFQVKALIERAKT